MTDKQLAVILTLGTAVIYYVGWVYLYNYYNFFGIDIFEIGPSIQYTLIYAFPALVHLLSPKGELFIFLPGLIILAIAYFTLFHAGKLKRSIALTLFVTLMLVESYQAAKSLARTNAIEKWMNDSNPAFLESVSTADGTQGRRESSADGGNGFSKKLEEFNKELQLRFILSTSQFHYLFTRSDCDQNLNVTCEGFLFRVRVADVKAIAILYSGEGKK